VDPGSAFVIMLVDKVIRCVYVCTCVCVCVHVCVCVCMQFACSSMCMCIPSQFFIGAQDQNKEWLSYIKVRAIFFNFQDIFA